MYMQKKSNRPSAIVLVGARALGRLRSCLDPLGKSLTLSHQIFVTNCPQKKKLLLINIIKHKLIIKLITHMEINL